MGMKLGYVTIDCNDARALAPFWAATLGWEITWQDDDGAIVASGDDAVPQLFLQVVPEPKSGKNRAHLDVIADDYQSDLNRITALGATILSTNCTPDGKPSSVLADPQGNEFCLA